MSAGHRYASGRVEGVIMDYIEYAEHMRAAAPLDDDVMQVSKDLWLCIAKVIEEAGQRIATSLADPRNDTPQSPLATAPLQESHCCEECPRLAVPCLPGAMVRFKGGECAWKVVCINFYAEGIPTASVTNDKITSTIPLTDLTEAEVLG